MGQRHRLNKAEQLRGVRKAIRVLRQKRGGPKWLLPSMRRYERKLAAEVRGG
jgi:hypothetical protein